MQISRRHFMSGMALAAAKLALPPDVLRFAAIGDMGTGDRPQYEVATRMSESWKLFQFDFVIMLGDNIYGGHSPSDYRSKFELPYKPLRDAGVQFYGALGNHDSDNERFYKPFSMNGQEYYSFRKGEVHFFALNSNYMKTEQLSWLEKELQGSNATWKICFFHHPLYSSGMFHGPEMELRSILEPLLLKYQVQTVFSGHEHIYERTKPQKGITYFTQGASGQLRRGNLRKTELTAGGYDQDRSFTLIEVSGGSMNFQTISRTGLLVDSGVIQREPASPGGFLSQIPSYLPFVRSRSILNCILSGI